ncbi:MAG TPA: DUF4242 domain-containing protein [Actinomycetota bacterium]|nr:DUF4242 domain-containing protein [Actinomycetota bacterium]
MPKFVIEREMPGVSKLTAEELCGAAQKSNDVLAALSPTVQWQQSYVTDDKIYCVYIADDADAVREHARRAGFPANEINRVSKVIDPTTADA